MKEENDILKEAITSGFKQDVPSFDFTDMVMDKIDASLELKGVVKPLISKSIWIWVASVFTGVICLSFLVEVNVQEVSLFDDFDFSRLVELKSTIYLTMTIAIILCVMTLADIFYRRSRDAA